MCSISALSFGYRGRARGDVFLGVPFNIGGFEHKGVNFYKKVHRAEDVTTGVYYKAYDHSDTPGHIRDSGREYGLCRMGWRVVACADSRKS